MRNNVQHVHYFVSKKQKKYFLRYLKKMFIIYFISLKKRIIFHND